MNSSGNTIRSGADAAASRIRRSEGVVDDSDIALDVDYEKLYYNMRDAKAEWLYKLSSWNKVLTTEQRDKIAFEYREANTVRSEKIGRNDPCPCGSGKKYKKCCGKNA